MPHITREHAPERPAPAPAPLRVEAPPEQPTGEPKGCLFAVSQPPLMLFLAVICTLLLVAGVHDQFWL